MAELREVVNARVRLMRWVTVIRCCLDPRVLAASAIGALGLLVFAPGLFWTVLPVICVIACPLSMLLMMGKGSRTGSPEVQADALAPLPRMRSRDAELRDLAGQLEGLRAQQLLISTQIDHLSRIKPASGRPQDLAG